MRIRGKIARILNSRELVINRGSEHGVEEGMLFDVLSAAGEDILDPDTGEVLGSLERAKVRIKVKRVEAKMAVAATYKTREVNLGGQGGISNLSKILEPPRIVKVVEKLVSDELHRDQKPEGDKSVSTGDAVVEVTDLHTELE